MMKYLIMFDIIGKWVVIIGGGKVVFCKVKGLFYIGVDILIVGLDVLLEIKEF